MGGKVRPSAPTAIAGRSVRGSPPPVTMTHGCSLSNAVLFVADAMGLFAEEGLDVVVPAFEALEGTVELLDGPARMGTAHFTAPLLTAHEDDPLVAVAGSGLGGIALVTRADRTGDGTPPPASLATFRGDPLQLMAMDVLVARHVDPTSVTIRYLRTMSEAVDALETGEVDAATVVEPFASRLCAGPFIRVSDGTDVWGERFLDTVFVVRRAALATDTAVVRAAIRALLRAEAVIDRDPAVALGTIRHRFPGYTTDELTDAITRQPPCVDIRGLEHCLDDRWPSLVDAGLVPPGPVPRGTVDLALLLDVLEGPDPATPTADPPTTDPPTADPPAPVIAPPGDPPPRRTDAPTPTPSGPDGQP